jgi:Holliday junction resolvasome RuvABC endonuclease subunit
MTRALAIDPGNLTGWAYGPLGESIITSGTWDCSILDKRFPGARYINLVRCLNALLEMHEVDFVVHERQIPGNPGQARAEQLIGFAETLKGWCALNEIPHHAVHSGTLKKWASGYGRADKEMMRRAAAKRWGASALGDDHEIDARWLWTYASEVLRRSGKLQ